jgi:outer membrane receptor protein involved in Fe transport
MMMSGTAVAAGLLVPLAAAAQDSGGQEIVVTGQGLPSPPGEAVYATAEIDRARIEANASGRMEDVLRDVAGLAQFRRSDSSSAHPTSQGITLRGLSGNAASRALLILDGVPQTDPFGGWVPFPAYLPERLAGVRVTRGGGSGYQGPGALAGTVELFSGTPAQIGKLDLRADYGSRNSVDAAAVGGANLGTGFVTLAGEYARSDGFTPTVEEDRGPVDRPAPYEQASLAARSVIQAGNNTELQANISAFTDKRDRGVDYTDIDSKGADASLRLVSRGNWAWSALGYLQVRQFASGFASINATRTVVTPSLNQYNVPATGVGGRFEIAPPIGNGVTLRLGTDIRAVSGRTEELYTFVSNQPTRQRIAGGDSLTAGGFADLSYETGPFTLNLGGRADHWSLTDGSLHEAPLSGVGAINNVAYPDRDGWEGTGRVGAAYKIDPAVTLRAAGYRGWRLPTLNELYRPYRVGADSTAANAALTPERLTGAEGGINLTPLAHFTASGTFYWNKLDDAIANVTLSVAPSGARTMQRQNVDNIEALGGELDLRWSDGPFNIAASYAYTDARVHASGAAAALNGKRPAQTAMNQASASAGWAQHGWGVSVTGRYVDPQFDDDQNTTVLKSAFTVDGSITAPITKGLSIEGRATNIFDARVETGVSGNDIVEQATPRTLWIGLRYRLR